MPTIDDIILYIADDIVLGALVAFVFIVFAAIFRGVFE